MPQPKKGPSLGSSPSHQHLMLRNLARSLFENERIKTTEAKAKLLRPYAERLITKAKGGSVHHRRQVLSEIQDRDTVHKLFADIGPRFSARNGGYTRVLKLGPRHGDAAPLAIIELVDAAAPGTEPAGTTEEGRRRRLKRPTRRRGAATAAAAGAEEEETGAEEEETGAEEEEAAAEAGEEEPDEVPPPSEESPETEAPEEGTETPKS